MSNKDECGCDQAKALQSELETLGSACDKMRVQHAETCRGLDDEVSRLGSEMRDLRAASYGVLAWIDRSTSVGREAAQRFERALAVGAREAEPEVVGPRAIVVGSTWRASATGESSLFTVEKIGAGLVTYLTPTDECWAFPRYTWSEKQFRYNFEWVRDP